MQLKSFAYRPRFETLEDRLPPGDLLNSSLSQAGLIANLRNLSRPSLDLASPGAGSLWESAWSTDSETADRASMHTNAIALISSSTPADAGAGSASGQGRATDGSISLGGSDALSGEAVADPLSMDALTRSTAGQTRLLTRIPSFNATGQVPGNVSAAVVGSAAPGSLSVVANDNTAIPPRILHPFQADTALTSLRGNGGNADPATFGTAPDATANGPLATRSAEYRFPASVDPDILGDRMTELWARVYRPADLSNGPYPVIVMLHGNHSTCGTGIDPRVDNNSQYTTTGTCPTNYVVVPSHMGYAYLADKLASWGYIVVSINADRGINAGQGVPGDAGLNLARGRLILKHIQRLSEWNNNPGTTPASLGVDLFGKLDFNSVGLFGHSRGGEGIRAAYNLYRDSGSPWPGRIPDPVNFEGLFEIGAVDGQTSRTLNADSTAWNQILPMCDGDVSDLEGVKPFDRMMNIDEGNPTQKSTYLVWGANHNFFNTEWQQSDSPGCTGTGNTPLFTTSGDIGSATQRRTAEASALAFFRGNVGPNADPTFNENFNPQYDLPGVVATVTRVDREYTDSPSTFVTTSFENFTRTTGTNEYGFPNDANDITITHGSVPNHDNTQRAGVISWTASAANPYFQTNWSAPGTGRDISNYATLDIRLSRQNSALNPVGPTDFDVQLVSGDGNVSYPVSLSSVADLRGPVGSPNGGLHSILQTARFSLSDFCCVDKTNIRGVRLVFDQNNQGAIYVANMQLSIYGWPAGSPGAPALADSNMGVGAVQLTHPNDVNTISYIHRIPGPNVFGNNPAVEIAVTSNREFPVRDAMAVLQIGTQQLEISRYPDSGDEHTLIFTMTADQFAQLANGDQVRLQYGQDQSFWDFGGLDLSLMQ